MRISRRWLAYPVIILIALVALFSAAFPVVPAAHAQTAFTNITSYRVSGAPNYTSPGGESFWSGINWMNAPLSATVSPGGGHTPNLLVKSANDGFNIYMLLRWNDTAGPSFLADTEIFYNATTRSYQPLTPAITGNVTQLYYNSTYYYPDRAAILWFVANPSQRQQSPVMQLGTDGAITGGAAEIWHWQTNPTDNNPNDAGFPGGYTDSAGNPVFPADNLSFAEDDYTNTTGFFVIAGNFGASTPNLVPSADPFEVHVGSYYSNASKTWTVEMVRSFTTSDASNYRVQLQTGSSYFIALAIWQGKLGESSNFKSVSQWYNITISNLSPASQAVSTGGVTIPLAIAAAVSALIVGIAIGTLVKSPKKK